MKTIFGSNEFKDGINKVKISALIQGIILLVIAVSGLFFDSKLILELFLYIIPIILLLNAVHILRIALYIRKTDSKHFILFIIQSAILIVAAIYIFLNPIKLLNYILIIIGVLMILNGINKLLANAKSKDNRFPVLTFFFGLLLICFSEQIIDTFYTFFLMFILLIGLSKIITFLYLLKIK